MAFQDSCYTIIIDAVLTDVGRKYMTSGEFKVVKYALGDDEIDYTLGAMPTDGSGWALNVTYPPILEAFAEPVANITSGLIDYAREDVIYLPIYKVNEKIQNAVNKRDGVYYLSVNDETTDKLKTSMGDTNRYLLQNNDTMTNMLLVESGISGSDEAAIVAGRPHVTPTIEQTETAQRRYIFNMGLRDKYVFVYCDSRLFENILCNNPHAYFKNDSGGNLYHDLNPLQTTVKISLGAFLKEHDTYYCTTVQNNLYAHGGTAADALSSIPGPRASVMALNFNVNSKLISLSSGTPDSRYTKFGQTSKAVFGDSNKYDFIDTIITLEGCSTGNTLQIPLRIIRFSGT